MIKHLYLFIYFILFKSSIKLPRRVYLRQTHLRGAGGLIETGGLFNLAKKKKKRRYHFSLKNQLECKVETLKHKKLEVMQLMIKNKSELPAVE